MRLELTEGVNQVEEREPESEGDDSPAVRPRGRGERESGGRVGCHTCPATRSGIVRMLGRSGRMEEVSEHTRRGQGIGAGLAVSAMCGWSWYSMGKGRRVGRDDIDVGRRLTWARAEEARRGRGGWLRLARTEAESRWARESKG